jgi:outer membrane lipoprotein-sorting protein
MNPKRTMSRIWIGAFTLAMTVAAQTQTTAAAKHNAEKTPQAAAKNPTSTAGSLDQVLHSMDENAAKFRTAQADFSWTPYNAVINSLDTPDKGRIYFRKTGTEIQMAARFQPPDGREITFTGGKLQVYQPKTKEINVYDASAHKDEVETFLVLGFGSSGEDLRKSFDIKYLGQEKIGDVETGHLQLTPLADNVKKSFPRIDLWIDPQRGLSVRQQLFQTGGDYRLADYSNIRLHEKVPDSVFKIKPPGGTKTVTH